MIGDTSKFIDITPKKSGHVNYGENNKGKILGIGRIDKNFSTSIEIVLLMNGLKHSLSSVSQLCDKGFFVSLIHKNVLLNIKMMNMLK
uniref:Retrovirus-related Pol polyprotein from transposon TNT 1-94-like beta-barrel domain-containing protein n=1 Tax=Cajanus cajan TaxID=3821 RepID=A0A151RXD8_CAJCA|nr:hypothetical protein KK1_031154 [Cajanus cajan]